MPQEQDMKHIVGETPNNKDNKPQGVHMPGVSESYLIRPFWCVSTSTSHGLEPWQYVALAHSRVALADIHLPEAQTGGCLYGEPRAQSQACLEQAKTNFWSTPQG